MERRLASLAIAACTAVVTLADGVTLAASPTTAECLAASDASLAADNRHELRAERAQLLLCAASSCPADIRKECVSRVDEVNGQIPTILFAVKDGSGADLSAVKVTMDGEVLAERLEGTALSIDPGEHTFTFEAEGQPPAKRVLLIQEAQKDRREVIALGAQASAPGPAAGARTAGAPVAGAGESHGAGAQKVLAIVAGAVGVVGLGFGAAFGVVARSQRNEAQGACPSNPCATQDGVDRWSSAVTSGNVSTIGFIVGGVGVVGATVLWLTAPSTPGTHVGFGPGFVQVGGSW